jgi:hypothetical protein
LAAECAGVEDDDWREVLTMNRTGLPVACSLTEAELQERRRDVLQKLRSAVAEVLETEDGYVYQFSSKGVAITELASMVELEHACCPFLTFRLIVEPGDAPIRLEITGPQGTKDFLAEVFN